MSGKVWLVGAGPGDTGLMTIKGRKVVEDADVVVYDHLVGTEIVTSLNLNHKKKMINVGKIAGHHPIPQDQINQILIEEAGKGQRVVRLKGGDPFLFGRGGEELEALKDAGIAFEVVPGVTSALAVPAYNGIPVTHRAYASSVHIITGHRKGDQKEEADYRSLVEFGGTLVFLMGVTALGNIMSRLLQAGIDPDMPAAILQEGTLSGQKKVCATVSTLARKAGEAEIKPPALIVVGRVCELSERLEWYEHMPLMGRKILLTRPKELISDMAEKLRLQGAEVLEIPSIEIVPEVEEERIRETFRHIEMYDWIVFTSQMGVKLFFEQMKICKVDIRCMSNCHFAVIGDGTRICLEKYGIYADIMPDVYDGVSLARRLADEEITGKKILIPRAARGNQQLVPILEKEGASVDDLPVYRTEYCDLSEDTLKEIFLDGKIDGVIFTSGSTVEGFVNGMNKCSSIKIDYSKIRAFCIGQQTAKTAEKYGMHCEVAEQATIDSLTELIIDIFNKEGKSND